MHYQEGIKEQCKQMWTFLKVFICGNKFCFQHSKPVLFSPKLYGLNWILIYDSSLLIMSARDKKSEFSAIFKKSKVNFLQEGSLARR